jgi:alpha-D-xyloside xylohydrolase
VARGYRERKLPLDVMVLDWFYWTRLGNLDIDRKFYPDPKGMNAELNRMGMHSLISVWPRFEKASKNFDMMASKGWLLHDKNGVPADGLAVRSTGRAR